MKPQPEGSADTPIVARPNDNFWFVAIMCGAMAVIQPFSALDPLHPWNSWQQIPPVFSLFAIWGIPALWVGCYCARCRAVADSEGLTLQSYFITQHVPWSGVEDFEMRFDSAGGKSAPPEAYVKLGGEWRRIPRSYRSYDALLQRIASKAQPDHTQPLSTPNFASSWRRTFSYPGESGYMVILRAFGMPFVGIIFSQAFGNGFPAAFSSAARAWSGLSLWQRAAFLAAPLLAAGVQRALMSVKQNRARFQNRKVVVTDKGLVFETGEQRTLISWDEITAYYLEKPSGDFKPMGYVVETAGGSAEFFSNLSNVETLVALVSKHAVNATTRKWGYRPTASR